MAAELNVRFLVECSGLGPGIIELGERWTDTNTPDDYRRVETVISTAAVLLSAMVNVPSSEIVGIGIKARGDTVYVNTISTNISTAGQAIPENQGIYMSFEPGNTCKITLKGGAADSAVTALIAAAAT